MKTTTKKSASKTTRPVSNGNRFSSLRIKANIRAGGLMSINHNRLVVA